MFWSRILLISCLKLMTVHCLKMSNSTSEAKQIFIRKTGGQVRLELICWDAAERCEMHGNDRMISFTANNVTAKSETSISQLRKEISSQPFYESRPLPVWARPGMNNCLLKNIFTFLFPLLYCIVCWILNEMYSQHRLVSAV